MVSIDTFDDTYNRERTWYFTFGSGHAYPDGYACFFGTYQQAREQMVLAFGSRWAFQYAGREAAGVDKYHLKQIEPMTAKHTGT